MKFICPLIVVEDIEKSRRFYETVLNQTIQADYGENVFFKGGFAIHQKKHFQSLINHADIISKSNHFELYFEHDRLEETVEKIKTLGLEFMHEIKEEPWKQRVIRFYDYDKNLIEIGESMEHTAFRLYNQNYSIEKICKITYLSREEVERTVEKYS